MKHLGAIASMLVLPALAAPAAGAGFSYDDWSKVLGKFVDQRGYVNYDALAKDRADLDRFLAAVEKTSPKSNPEMFPTKNDQLAYWINAYNAQVFKGVLARGPEKESVWKGGLVSGYSFFVGMDIVLGGEKTHLKTLEDKTIRDGFKDPRIHAALNCASKGCPRLPQTAFLPEKLDQQLDQGMTEFLAEKRNVTVDDASKTVTLSKILDWFSKDFLGYEAAHGNPSGTQIDYVNRYRASNPKVPKDYKVKFFEYDKSINKQ
ncbi:MAG TPA: DUF547 domain-containing protein [Thermoanaerobaculia bacterium]|nr:DUF547 domain-containing protein [Thermoanaerobaculia bacterium]